MIRNAAIALALFLLPVTSWAQDGLGLDLTAPEEKTPEGATPPENSSQDSFGATDSSTSNITAPVPDEDQKPAAASRESLLEGERDVTVDDRVKSVQRKLYLKRHRFELAPYLSFAVNDPYYMRYGVAVRGAYYLADTLALSARFSLISVVPTDDVRTATRTFQSRIFFSVPQWSGMGDVEWSPIYGKVAIWNDIWHFDAYLLGGLGVMNTETSSLPDRGLNPAADLGLGVRFVARDYLALNAALINTSYVDAPAGTTKGATQNILTLNAGVSIFFPFKSTSREAE